MATLDIKKIKYDTDQILAHFGLERKIGNCVLLQKWLDVTIAPNYVLSEQLERKRLRLIEQGSLWNEEELKMHFISYLFDVADMEIPKKMQLFYERSLVATVNNTPLSVICDALLATPLGVNTPNIPYFFLQEFKKGKKAQDDAEGQMLIAMLIAQELNKNGQMVYGCYLQGQYWNFAILSETTYCLSLSYDATRTNELIQIIHILQNLKNRIVF
ncbi:MAG: hypothetical protein JNM36_01015 [Chitinophagales bacterium]|jgi:hypothetical protein|nr:hypothetical protein [Chitinophagales bacterium]